MPIYLHDGCYRAPVYASEQIAYSEQCVQVHRTLISQESHSHRIVPTVANVHSTAQLPPSSVRTVYERQLNPANWTECFLSLLFRLETDRRDGRTQGHFTVGMFFVVLFSIWIGWKHAHCQGGSNEMRKGASKRSESSLATYIVYFCFTLLYSLYISLLNSTQIHTKAAIRCFWSDYFLLDLSMYIPCV